MDSDIKKLYLFHLFNSIAVTVATNYIFIDKIMLRMNLNMQQFGIIKGIGWFIPMTLSWLLAPFIQKINRDREIIALGYIIRLIIPFGFILLPGVTSDIRLLTIGCMVILLSAQLFPIIANNSLQSLIKYYIPRERLGMHLSKMTCVWFIPAMVLAIPCTWYLDSHSKGNDTEFFRAFFVIMLATTVFQIGANIAVMKMKRPEFLGRDKKRTNYNNLFKPFQDRKFRIFLLTAFIYGNITSMTVGFVNPCLIEAHGMSLTWISILGAGVALMSIVYLPVWGHLSDRLGGKNIFRFNLLGLCLGLLMLAGRGPVFIIIFSLFAWNIQMGFFGTGVSYGYQHLAISFARTELRNIYLATVSLILGAGWLTGSTAGGFFLNWLETIIKGTRFQAGDHYRIYFALCGLICLILFPFISAIPEKEEKIKNSQMWMEIYSTVRNSFRRWR